MPSIHVVYDPLDRINPMLPDDLKRIGASAVVIQAPQASELTKWQVWSLSNEVTRQLLKLAFDI